MEENVSVKIQLDLKPETIGQVDLLIESGLYKDRLAFLENAINNLLDVHKGTISNFKVKNGFSLGLVHYSRKELEKFVADGKKLQVKIIGGLSLDNDVSPELANRAIDKINLAGVFRASEGVKKALETKQYTLLGNRKKYLLSDPKDNVIDWNKD